MDPNQEKYGLDLHCNMLLDEYNENMPSYRKILQIAKTELEKAISEIGLYIVAQESRIKTEASLAGKLDIKGYKYNTVSDITDIVGIRVVTFFSDEVDKVAVLIDKLFDVDWSQSVDKRTMHALDSFGYNSLHYICRIPKSLFHDPAMPMVNELRFEVQMRTALQHVWANMNHDTGYKSGVDVPKDYIRNLNCLAGMLELADEQFSRIRTEINDYRRKVQALVAGGKITDIPLDMDSYTSYLKLKPFDKLTKRIAAINQAEIYESSAIKYLSAFKALGFQTLGDLQNLIDKYGDNAYELAAYQIGRTDIDIISSTIAIQDLLEVYIIRNGGGVLGLEKLFEKLSGPSDHNRSHAERVLANARCLKFMTENG
ncbi:MAG: hypothetical protein KBS80_03995 [Bacteroidales bacterium]|nr:hypothetical protein [Candidatus Cryptobacteroides choladohippi]